jgi:hypothetical protein
MDGGHRDEDHGRVGVEGAPGLSSALRHPHRDAAHEEQQGGDHQDRSKRSQRGRGRTGAAVPGVATVVAGGAVSGARQLEGDQGDEEEAGEVVHPPEAVEDQAASGHGEQRHEQRDTGRRRQPGVLPDTRILAGSVGVRPRER